MLNNQNETAEEGYLSDNNLATKLSVSPSWVRKQRHLRNKGEDHSLTIDAIYVGSSPRYKASEVNQWLDNLTTQPKGK